MLITTDGLVARVFDGSGTDRYIHLLTPTRGRLTVTIKNGQSGRASIASYSQVFTYGNYENVRIPLAGAYQPENAASVIAWAAFSRAISLASLTERSLSTKLEVATRLSAVNAFSIALYSE